MQYSRKRPGVLEKNGYIVSRPIPQLLHFNNIKLQKCYSLN